MEKMNKVVHFEIPADDLDRAKKFYKDVFGWQLVDQPEMNYTLATTSETDDKMMPKEVGSINGGIMRKSDMVKHPSLAIDVDDIDDAMKRVKKEGGTILTAKILVGDMGLMVYFKDPEGNVMSLWEGTENQ